ncbi:MAG TPA: DUF4388 domain-containing protein [Bdellovibrionota bacterium]|nr:DUF4388 domain-containing protein [Bdellovibrionota bacterium]
MKKSALIISSAGKLDVPGLEKALLTHGFNTVRVNGLRDAFFRIDNERFSGVILEDMEQGKWQREFAEGISRHPFGITTPVVVIGGSQQPAERAAMTSILDQYFPVETDVNELAEFVNETCALQGEKAKRGKLGPVSIPLLLVQAARFRLDGAVVVERGEEKCIIYMEKGYVVFASSNRDENRFGEFLVQQGIISRDDFLRAAKLLQSSGKRLGRILVDEGILKPQVLQTLIQSQVKHIVYTVFDWKEGEFYILSDERSCQDEPVARFETARLILEGVRFKFSESRLNEEFRPFDQKVSLAVSLDECQRRVHLGKNEIDFLSLIGTGRLIGELLNLNSYSRLESLKLLYSFRILGFLSLERGAGMPLSSSLSPQARSKAMDDLFAAKEHKAAPAHMEVHETSSLKRPHVWRAAYMAAGAVALSATWLIVTFVDTRFSREGQTHPGDRYVDVEQDPVIHSLEMKKLAPEPSVAPVQATPEATPSLAAVTTVPEPTIQATSTPSETPTPEVASVEDTLRRFSEVVLSAEKHRRAGQLQVSLEQYRKAEQIDAKHLGVTLAIADILFDMNRIDEAERQFSRAKKLDSSNPRPYLALGTIYLLQDQSARAVREYEAYLRVVPQTPQNQSRITEVQRILQNLSVRP